VLERRKLSRTEAGASLSSSRERPNPRMWCSELWRSRNPGEERPWQRRRGRARARSRCRCRVNGLSRGAKLRSGRCGRRAGEPEDRGRNHHTIAQVEMIAALCDGFGRPEKAVSHAPVELPATRGRRLGSRKAHDGNRSGNRDLRAETRSRRTRKGAKAVVTRHGSSRGKNSEGFGSSSVVSPY